MSSPLRSEAYSRNEMLRMTNAIPTSRFTAWFAWAVLASIAFGQPSRGEFQEVNRVAEPPADRAVAITGARLIDGHGGPPIDDAVVVVRGSRIEAAGPRDRVEIPRGAERFDAAGLTVLPGFVDAHFHAGNIPDIPTMFLRAGVTTARDPGMAWERYDPVFKRGKPLPRLFLTDRHLDQEPPAHPLNTIVVRTAEEAKTAVNRAADRGATAVKVYFRLPPDLIRVACEAAHARGLPVVAHLELVRADVAIEAGIDGLEHVSSVGTVVAEPAAAEAFRAAVDANNQARITGRYTLWAGVDLGSPRVQRMIDLMKQRDVVLSPTLTYFYGTGPGSKQTNEEQREGFRRMLAFVRKCHEAGVQIAVGSHTMLNVEPEGKAYQREMEFLVQAGLPPMDVLVAATMGTAKYLRVEKRVGSIERGKLADLVLIDGDPLKDIRATRNVRRVMLNGVWLEEPATR